MADNRELDVNIPEELYEAYKGRPPMLGDAGMDMIAQSIANGVPLPKGHGRIGDLDIAYEAIKDYQDTIRSVGKFDADKASTLTLLGRCKELINGVDAVIAADKEVR
ncbi:hypothetical protein [Butyrivibrio sp.]|uniref:hypothetical protein n=1 Tax=Butyrivibrio sp. TaxID=28121 RepID=UPI0025C0A433|nr:hypothetical protein [Butyrivibrio sp.]MBQ9302736.1 hypothetical protein [Butyrivibrio sp.]